MLLNSEFKTIACCVCGFTFAVPKTVQNNWRETHQKFYCPACKCAQSYHGESDVEKYKRLYEQKLSCCIDTKEQLEHEKHRANGYKGALIKANKQIKETKNNE